MAVDGSISNLVIYRNGAPKAAGIILDETTGHKVRNCIITTNGDGDGVFGADSPNIMWQYSNVCGNKGGDYGDLTPAVDTVGNIKQPPFFLNATAFDCHLRPDSPCIDRGTRRRN